MGRRSVGLVLALVGVLVGMVASAGGAIHAEEQRPPELVAAAAIALDAETGQVLFAKNADERRAPASLTKLATALTAIDLAPLDTPLRVETGDLVGEASMGLRPGETISLESALYGLLLASGNDAAMTIARNLSALPGEDSQASVARFVRQMNLVAERLGLTRTTFRNPHGLDEPGHLTTARDLAVLTRAVLQRPELRRILSTASYSDGVHSVQSTNRLLGQYPGLIGGKTGITDAAGYSLIEAAERDGRTVIVVVLGSTQMAWYDDAVRLLDYAFAVAPQAGGEAAIPATAVPEDTRALEPSPGSSGALVLQVPAVDTQSTAWWFWPMSALTTVTVAGVLVSGLPLLGALVAVRRRGRARSPRHPVRHRRTVGAASAIASQRGAAVSRNAGRTRTDVAKPRATVIAFDPAAKVAQRAVRAARRGDVPAAEAGFTEALRIDPTYDLSRTPEFWTIPAAGVIAAARAYQRVGRVRDARTLLTVAELSFGPLPAIQRALSDLRPDWQVQSAIPFPVPERWRS